jgi:hypothetical protein
MVSGCVFRRAPYSTIVNDPGTALASQAFVKTSDGGTRPLACDRFIEVSPE